MECLNQFWHPVALSSAVTAAPLGVSLLGEELVLWRTDAGVSAARDVCIHRGTRLSLGCIDRGDLVCPYHGWRYNSDGAVVRIPAIPAERKIPRNLKVPTFRCQERYGLVFVCLGEPRHAIYEVPEFEQNGFKTHVLGPVVWRASAARSFENFIDEAHLPWVHPGFLGNKDNVPVIPKRDITKATNSFYFEYHSECRDRIDPSKMTMNLLTYDVVLPFSLYHENVSPAGERVIDLFFVTPLSESESIRFMVVARNFALDQPSDKFEQFTLNVWQQDQVIVESQRPEQVPLQVRTEMHIRGPDSPSLLYREKLREMGLSDWA